MNPVQYDGNRHYNRNTYTINLNQTTKAETMNNTVTHTNGACMNTLHRHILWHLFKQLLKKREKERQYETYTKPQSASSNYPVTSSWMLFM